MKRSFYRPQKKEASHYWEASFYIPKDVLVITEQE